MSSKVLFTFTLALLFSFGISAQKDKSGKGFRELFLDATDLSFAGNFEDALPLWLELEQMQPKNSNVKFAIGDCYLHSKFQKKKSIEYFEAASKKMTLNYIPGDPKQKRAPLDVTRMLGEAYHVDYQFDKALEQYQEYLSILSPSMRREIKTVERDIEITNHAIELTKDPKDISIRMAYDMNTVYPEYRPTINADETMMIFTARKDDSNGGELDEDGGYFEDLYVSYKERGIWSKPIHLEGLINTNSHEASMYLSPQGNHMLIYKDDGTELEGSIFESFLMGDRWSEPEILKGKMNSTAWESHAALSVDQKTMVFTSDRSGGQGDRDIWITKKNGDGGWSKPKNMGEAINTKYDEESAYLHPDGKTLYFSSKGHNSMGGFDVFVAELLEDGTWGNVRNIGYPINTTGHDVFYTPTADGKRAYFSSFRQGGRGHQDVYIMELNSELEKNLTVYKGLAKDIEGGVIKNLVITVFDEKTDDLYGVHKPDPITGKFMFILRPGHTYEIEYTVDGVVQTESVEITEDGGFEQLGRLVVKENDAISVNAHDVDDLDIQEMATRKKATDLEVVELDVSLTAKNRESDKKVEVHVEEDVPEGEEEAPVDKAEVKKEQNKMNMVLEEGGTFVLDGVVFEYNSYQLTKHAKAKVDLVYKYMLTHENMLLRISGHTDSKGGDDFNKELSHKRAKSVRNYLKEKGIDRDRLKYKGYGEEKLLEKDREENGDYIESAMKRNRRVEFNVEPMLTD